VTRLAERCRHLAGVRRARGIRQQTVAEALGVSVNTVSSWERCKARPTDEHLAAWAAYLGEGP
jgi:transcriptional regulator with XRE-family HTH domain